MEIEKGIILEKNCLIDKRSKVLALSDLHIGFEEGIGLLLRQQMDKAIRDIEEIANKYDIKTIVICGDIKQEFGKDSEQGWQEIRLLIKRLANNRQIIITKGNHDFYIENIVKGIAKVVEKITIGSITYTHGHKNIKWKKLLVIGNEHPAIKIKDKLGAIYSYSAFLYFREQGIVVLPSANPWTKGTNVLSLDFISEPLKKLSSKEKEDAEVYAIDENVAYIGKIKELRKIKI